MTQPHVLLSNKEKRSQQIKIGCAIDSNNIDSNNELVLVFRYNY